MNFDCIFTKKVNQIEMEVVPFSEIYESIQDGSYQNIVKNLRNIKNENEFGDYKRNNFPQFTIGSFKDNIRKDENLISVKHLMFDIDKVSEDKLNEIRKKLIANKYCYCFFTSCSGKGIKAIFETEEIFISAERFKIVYEHYWNDLQKNLGIELDRTFNPSRGSYLSYDKDIFLNTENEKLSSVHIKAKEINKTALNVPNGKYFDVIDKNRNVTLTSYLGLLHSNGDGIDIIKFNAHCYNQNYFNPPLPESEVNAIINSVTKYKSEKKTEIVTYDLSQVFDEYLAFSKIGDEKRVKTGIQRFDKVMMGGYLAGEVLGLVALTGGGKTTFGLNAIIQNAERSNKEMNVYFSLEMPRRILLQRILQIKTGNSGTDIWNYAKRDDKTFMENSRNILSKLNIEIVDKRIAIYDYLSYIYRIEDKYKMKVSLTLNDHCGLFKSNQKTDKSQASEIANNIVEYSKEGEFCAFSLYQAPREDIKVAKRLTLHSFKESGDIENSLRYAIVFNNITEFNREFYNITEPEYNHVSQTHYLVSAELAKNTNGAMGINQIMRFCKQDLKFTQYDNFQQTYF